MKRIPRVILILIGINFVFFLPYLLAEGLYDTLLDHFALFFIKNDDFHAWQFFTYMFLHGNELHIIFNMVALASFGIPLSVIWGWRRFLCFFLITGIGAGIFYTAVGYFQYNQAFQTLVESGLTPKSIDSMLIALTQDGGLARKISDPALQDLFNLYRSAAVGASGAIYGILVAFGVRFPNAKLILIILPVPIKAKYLIPALISGDLFFGITGVSILGGGIAHFAHVGGAAIGLVISLYWKFRLKETGNYID